MVIAGIVCRLISFLLVAILLQTENASATPSVSSEKGPTIRHHDLFVQFHPDTHTLIGQDRITLNIPQTQQPIRLTLATTLTVDRMTLASEGRQAEEPAHEIPFAVTHGSGAQLTQHITIPASAVSADTITIALSYHGTINDPPKDPRNLRFVTPSETAGHIGSEGIYLSGESQWYPDVANSLSTYLLRVALPDGWIAVTQAKARGTILCPTDLCRQSGLAFTEWNRTQPSEALTLAANRFVTKMRTWTATSGQSVQLATYLFPEDADLADEYLDATERYLDAYIPLLGPYPFDTFAVVENFFASGLGMPSFTLLGSGVIKRHYVQPYALGHEIVHSWIGNAVFNRTDRGNWVEGLTTYLANYYWHELAGDRSQAREQRRLFVRGYNLHVLPERDYPIGDFTQKQDERDNAIGYQKAAMVFHLLRQEIGDDAFWPALRGLIAEYRWRHAEWRDVERLFSEASGHNLRWFFIQWVEQAGAPSLSLSEAVARSTGAEAARSFRLDVTIAQSGAPFRVPVQLQVRLEDGREHTVPVHVSERHEAVSIGIPARTRPMEVTLDPDAVLMRRIARRSLPPVLNHYVTDQRRSVVLAFSDQPAGRHPYRDLVERIERQDRHKPESERTRIVHIAHDRLLPQEGSVLVLGGAEARSALQSMMAIHCGERISLHEQSIYVDGTPYEGAGIALLASCHRVDDPDSVVTWVYATTPEAVSTVSRLLFFYGWSSYVVFKDGAVVTRGEWPVTNDRTDRMEVRFDGNDVGR